MPETKLKVAAIQMRSTPNKAANLEQAEQLFHEAVRQRAKLIALPENFALLSENRKILLDGAEGPNGLTTRLLKSWAKKNRVWIQAGGLQLKAKGEKITNTSLMINPRGEVVGRYDKIHLFDVNLSADKSYRESKLVVPGKKAVAVNAKLGRFNKVGLSVCYDIRFPELYRRLSKLGAQILFIPAAFTAVTGKAHWDILTRARAVENQCYVIAAGQTGQPYPGRKTHGHTRIVNPWGEVLAEKKQGKGVVIAQLSYNELIRIRSELPSLEHRKL